MSNPPKPAGGKTRNVVPPKSSAEQMPKSSCNPVVLQGDNPHKDIEETLSGKKLSLVLDMVGGTPVGELAKSLKIGGSVVGYAAPIGELQALSTCCIFFH